jgi:CRISPR-associated protein Cas5d
VNSSAAFGFRLLVEGDVACFRRPEFASDLVTYDVMPPTVANRLIGASLPGWTAGATRIQVLNPIVRRWQALRTARGTKRCHVLDNVAYVLEGEAAASAAGSLSEMKALMAKADVHLGLSDFPARVSLLDGDAPRSALAGSGTIDLGWMVYDLKSGGSSAPRFFRAVMHDGVMAIPPQELADLAR